MMNQWRIWIGLVLLLGGVANLKAEGTVVDLRDIESTVSRSFAGSGDGWSIAGEVTFAQSEQRLKIRGTYESDQAIEPRSALSYQVFDHEGDLLVPDGPRYPWAEGDGGGLIAHFDLDLTFWNQDPNLADFAIQFNAVVEGEYWYRDSFPDIEFARLEIEGGPRRESFAPGWIFRPSFLPAQTVVQLPVGWQVHFSDADRSGFKGSLDVLLGDTDQRVETPRISWARESVEGYGVWQWQVLSPVEAGSYQVRPGLVWDDVRWYEQEGWFEYEEIVFISPLFYLGGIFLVMALLGWGWSGVGKRLNGWRWWVGVSLLVPVTIWWGLHTFISNSWVVVLALGAVTFATRFPWRTPGGRVYACTLIYVTFIEVFWGQVNQVALVWKTATVFSIAVWALLLAPLLLIRARWLRYVAILVTMAGWLFISTGSVFYFQFFQDFPSIENLLYAGQIGDLGDSIVSIGQQSFLVPIIVGALFAGIVWWFSPPEDVAPSGKS